VALNVYLCRKLVSSAAHNADRWILYFTSVEWKETRGSFSFEALVCGSRILIVFQCAPDHQMRMMQQCQKLHKLENEGTP
jgi:hypothetical protein